MQASQIFERNGKVIVVKPKLADWESGVIITCSKCGTKEVVNEGSFCDLLKLCVPCGKKEVKARYRI